MTSYPPLREGAMAMAVAEGAAPAPAKVVDPAPEPVPPVPTNHPALVFLNAVAKTYNSDDVMGGAAVNAGDIQSVTVLARRLVQRYEAGYHYTRHGPHRVIAVGPVSQGFLPPPVDDADRTAECRRYVASALPLEAPLTYHACDDDDDDDDNNNNNNQDNALNEDGDTTATASSPFRTAQSDANGRSDPTARRARRAAKTAIAPAHVLELASMAYFRMLRSARPQTLVFRGPSGSGKTFQRRLAVRQIIANSVHMGHQRNTQMGMALERLERLFDLLGEITCDPTTERQRSVHGVSLTLSFTSQGRLAGIQSRLFPTDPLRVAGRFAAGERNHAVFYSLLAGCDPETAAELHLNDDPATYNYLGGTYVATRLPDPAVVAAEAAAAAEAEAATAAAEAAATPPEDPHAIDFAHLAPVFLYESFQDAQDAGAHGIDGAAPTSVDAPPPRRGTLTRGAAARSLLRHGAPTGGVHSLTSADARAFHTFLKDMAFLGLTQASLSELIRVLAAILHLGNIGFIASDDLRDDGAVTSLPRSASAGERLQCAVRTQQPLVYAAELLGVPSTALEDALVGRDRLPRGHSAEEAVEHRDHLASCLYSGLVDRLIELINLQLAVPSTLSTKPLPTTLTLVDFPGFEQLKHEDDDLDLNDSNGRTTHGFESFVVNMCNEVLNHRLTHTLLDQPAARLTLAGCPIRSVTTTDNAIADFATDCDGRDGEGLRQLFARVDLSPADLVDLVVGKHPRLVSNDPLSKYLPQGPSHVIAVAHTHGRVAYNLTRFHDKNIQWGLNAPPWMTELFVPNPTMPQIWDPIARDLIRTILRRSRKTWYAHAMDYVAMLAKRWEPTTVWTVDCVARDVLRAAANAATPPPDMANWVPAARRRATCEIGLGAPVPLAYLAAQMPYAAIATPQDARAALARTGWDARFYYVAPTGDLFINELLLRTIERLPRDFKGMPLRGHPQTLSMGTLHGTISSRADTAAAGSTSMTTLVASESAASVDAAAAAASKRNRAQRRRMQGQSVAPPTAGGISPPPPPSHAPQLSRTTTVTTARGTNRAPTTSSTATSTPVHPTASCAVQSRPATATDTISLAGASTPGLSPGASSEASPGGSPDGLLPVSPRGVQPSAIAAPSTTKVGTEMGLLHQADTAARLRSIRRQSVYPVDEPQPNWMERLMGWICCEYVDEGRQDMAGTLTPEQIEARRQARARAGSFSAGSPGANDAGAGAPPATTPGHLGAGVHPPPMQQIMSFRDVRSASGSSSTPTMVGDLRWMGHNGVFAPGMNGAQAAAAAASVYGGGGGGAGSVYGGPALSGYGSGYGSGADSLYGAGSGGAPSAYGAASSVYHPMMAPPAIGGYYGQPAMGGAPSVLSYGMAPSGLWAAAGPGMDEESQMYALHRSGSGGSILSGHGASLPSTPALAGPAPHSLDSPFQPISLTNTGLGLPHMSPPGGLGLPQSPSAYLHYGSRPGSPMTGASMNSGMAVGGGGWATATPGTPPRSADSASPPNSETRGGDPGRRGEKRRPRGRKAGRTRSAAALEAVPPLPAGVTKDAVVAAVVAIVNEGDLNTLTSKAVRARVNEQLGLDARYKALVQACIEQAILEGP